MVRRAWENETDLPTTIKLFTDRANHWNKSVFGNLFARKKRVLARLNGVQKALLNWPNQFLVQLEKSLKYTEIMLQEEEFWTLKSHLN